MPVDPRFLEFLDLGRKHKVTARIVVVADGQVIVGLVESERAFVEHTNTAIDGLRDVVKEDVPVEAWEKLRLAVPSGDIESDAYIGLRDVHLASNLGPDLDLPDIRVKLDAITAWGVLGAQPDEKNEGSASGG